ncbi:hypothetical protein HNO52_17425 [Billgrantia diversa]|uniref:hypothetical protein n=1 Tax=Halomonas sp. MCCC 1A13316 TaxID=2733487 RepID=UPI0018A416E6|nr:hypothetical protein [Halomonas sp. MCCC 1A13316]QOR40099.1 hypothetical protein HNO52_17425 [Halomonas sp. MCCC 1A13316]
MRTETVRREAAHLLEDLRRLQAEGAVAELLLCALDHEPIHHVTGFIWETLEWLDTALLVTARAEAARRRLRSVASLFEALGSDELRYGI